MPAPLEDLLQRWAEEAAERAQLDAVVDLDDGDVDLEAAIERLHHEPDPEVTSPWRRSS